MNQTVLVTNIPAPYRERVHELISQHTGGCYHVIYCAEKEADRDWKFTLGNYKKTILAGTNKNGVHNNVSVVKHLSRLQPDVVIVMGFFPTMLYSYAWSLLNRRKLIVFTDGTINSESHLSFVHRIVRRLVFLKTEAFIGPSLGAAALYQSYGIKREKFFRTYLAIDNSKFFNNKDNNKEYDLMFSGQFIDRKLPKFFIRVAKLVQQQVGSCKILILGDGNLKSEMIMLLKQHNLEYTMPGYINQADLPKFYSKCKLFLFPTKNDPWGVVVNEAMACGLPVLTCEAAGVAGDLVINNVNGYILPLVEEVWANHSVKLLTNKNLYHAFSNNSIRHVQQYNFENAANGITDAIKYVTNEVETKNE
jgi:glycosyltransferase involved in cell wall biosynthesis